MKVAVSAAGQDLESQVNPRLGRCEYFVVYDPDSGDVSHVENTGVNATGAAGIATAGLLSDLDVDILVTGMVGPNAFAALQAGGIKIYTGASGKVKDAIEMYRKGKLTESKGANSPGYHGR